MISIYAIISISSLFFFFYLQNLFPVVWPLVNSPGSPLSRRQPKHRPEFVVCFFSHFSIILVYYNRLYVAFGQRHLCRKFTHRFVLPHQKKKKKGKKKAIFLNLFKCFELIPPTSVNVGFRQGETGVAGTEGEVADGGSGPDGGGDGEPKKSGAEEAQHPLRRLGCNARLPGGLVTERHAGCDQHGLHHPQQGVCGGVESGYLTWPSKSQRVVVASFSHERILE